MDDKQAPALTGAALTQYMIDREAARSASGGTPAAMESALSRIADDVTREAIERRRLAGKT